MEGKPCASTPARVKETPERALEDARAAAQAGDVERFRASLQGVRLHKLYNIAALSSNNLAIYQAYLDAGGMVNDDWSYTGTPLISCITRNNKSFIRFLLDKGADPNFGHFGHYLPPIAVATRFLRAANFECFEWLFDAGARIENTGSLHIASFLGDTAKMNLLLQHGANVSEVPTLPIYASLGYRKRGTPVHWAIAGGHVEAVQLLLTHGPDLDVVDEDGTTMRDSLSSNGIAANTE